jgi:hypothetical protein
MSGIRSPGERSDPGKPEQRILPQAGAAGRRGAP